MSASLVSTDIICAYSKQPCVLPSKLGSYNYLVGQGDCTEAVSSTCWHTGGLKLIRNDFFSFQSIHLGYCKRGCRLFTLIDFIQEDDNLNNTRDSCAYCKYWQELKESHQVAGEILFLYNVKLEGEGV